MKLLYAIDIRDDALWHLDEVERWATRLNAKVDLLYVDPFGNYAPQVHDAGLREALESGLRRTRNAAIDKVTGAMAQLPREIRGEVSVAAGDAAQVIAEKGQAYDAVVLSTRATTGVRRLWLGSVAERVLRLHQGTSIVLHPRD